MVSKIYSILKMQETQLLPQAQLGFSTGLHCPLQD